MKIALAQINPVIGDIPGNKARILEYYERARKEGAELVVFSELALVGYPPQDLLRWDSFVRAAMDAVESLAAVADVPLALGTPWRDSEEDFYSKKLLQAMASDADLSTIGILANATRGNFLERKIYNAILVLAGGKIVHRVYKRRLAANAFFDERRSFTEGDETFLWSHAGENIAFGFGDPISEEYQYPNSEKMSLSVNLGASVFNLFYAEASLNADYHAAKGLNCVHIHVNQLGSNGEYIFDGGSSAVFPDGRIARCARFTEDLLLIDTASSEQGVLFDAGALLPQFMMNEYTLSAYDLSLLHTALVFGLREYVRKSGFTTVVLGLSGGLDSAVVAALAAEALGPENVVGVSMPSRYSSGGSVGDALALARNLGIRVETLPIAPLVNAYEAELSGLFAGLKPGLAEENLQARIRGTLLMSLSNKFGWMLLATGNKSEIAVGYCTLYGDTCGALAVIGDVYKTQLYALAGWMNRDGEVIPQATIDKPPSAELAPGQKDSDSLPPYDVLDDILMHYLDLGNQVEAADFVSWGHDENVVRSVIALVERSEFKRRQLPPVLRVYPFTPGRRLSLTMRPIL